MYCYLALAARGDDNRDLGNGATKVMGIVD